MQAAAGAMAGVAVAFLGIALATFDIVVGTVDLGLGWLFGGALVVAGILLVVLHARSLIRLRRGRS